MSEEDQQRIEPSLSGAGRAINQTPEHIEALRERQRQHDKLTQPPPQQKFTDVLQKSQAQAQHVLQQDNNAAEVASSATQEAHAEAEKTSDKMAAKPLHPGLSRPNGRRIIRG